jgi:aspartyl-tRNA(Asn)/glutamyl-tRNA(Gln) amidotransferase subunit A
MGAVAREHTLPSLLLDFEVVGPIARTVADARLLFGILRGPLATDQHSFALEAARQPPGNNRPLRVLYVPTLEGAPVDPFIAASCRQAADRLQQLGHTVTSGELPLDLRWMAQAWPQVSQIGLAAAFARQPHWRAGAADKYQRMAQAGAALPAALLWDLLAQVQALRRACVGLFEMYDLVAMPSAAALPWPAAEAFPPEINGQSVGPRGHAIFTAWVNAAGLPAVALPAAPAPNGLPIGIQLISAYSSDDSLLALAGHYEALSPWASRWPAL